MSSQEAQQFETDPRLRAILSMRTWDERAKAKDMKMEPLSKYRELFASYMTGALSA